MTETAPLIHYDFPLRLDDRANTHRLQLDLVPEGARVLEVGCHTGLFGSTLKQHRNASVVGIDYDPGAIAIAETRLDSAFVVNIEQTDWTQHLLARVSADFDAIVFGDVLEHTQQPESILRAARTLLNGDGRVIVSLPNVANLRVRLGLLKGNFDYADSGILDRTHLRFFTWRSARELLEAAGYEVFAQRAAGYSLPYWLINAFPGLLAVQIVLGARARR